MNGPIAPFFEYQSAGLCCDDVALAELARTHGTPLYVYAARAIDEAYAEVDRALGTEPHTIAYAMKANDSLAIASRLKHLGASVDIVSGGELARALRAGFAPERIVFSGVGKRREELHAAVSCGIRSIHVECESELDAIETVARDLGRRQAIALRVNPDIDPGTHPYVSTGLDESKFGLTVPAARALVSRVLASPHLELEAVACHIGSQIPSPVPIRDAVRCIAELALEFQRMGAPIRRIDAGGGWPATYGNEASPLAPVSAYGAAVTDGLRAAGIRPGAFELMVELGRALVANAGVIVTEVLAVKAQGTKTFVVVDAAMTELIRPALYGAFHWIVPLSEPPPRYQALRVDVVGPVCETADFLARGIDLPALRPGDRLAILSAGAYARSMASTYNSRPRAAEVLVECNAAKLIRRREAIEDLFRDEV